MSTLLADENNITELSAIENRLLQLLVANAYANYAQSLHGCSAPIGKDRFDFFKKVQVGHLVMETTTLHMKNYHRYRIGTLLTDQLEPYGTDEWWEANKAEYDGKRPMERVYTIKPLLSNKPFRWMNANLIRVVDNLFGDFPS